MKRTIMWVIIILILVNVSMAVEKYYSLHLNHLDGIITFRNINLLSGEVPEIRDEGAYTLRLISFYNTILQELKFNANENGDFTLYIPYHKEAKEIVISKDRERIFGYDISAYADVCGDRICQLQESYENCKKDCPSGLRDDYCDMVEDDKCDPDCSVELDADCAEEPTIGEEIMKEPEIKDEAIEERTIKEQKGKIPILYYMIPILITAILVIAVSFSSRYKAKKQDEEKLKEYIDNNLRMGYEPE